jgi:hypothetical protein
MEDEECSYPGNASCYIKQSAFRFSSFELRGTSIAAHYEIQARVVRFYAFGKCSFAFLNDKGNKCVGELCLLFFVLCHAQHHAPCSPLPPWLPSATFLPFFNIFFIIIVNIGVVCALLSRPLYRSISRSSSTIKDYKVDYNGTL